VKGDFEAMRRWFARGLEERSLEANQLLCARAALRSVPFLSSWLPIPKLTVGNALYIGLLGVLRCYPISVSAMQLPLAVANEFKTRAAIASSAISDLSFIPLAAKSAANIAAHSEVDVYSNALTCAASAKTGAPEAYHAAAFEQDCRLLDSIGLTALACHRLWPDWDGEVAAAILPLMPADDGFDPSPKAFREELARFIPSMRNLPGDFLVWVEWYDGIVRGSRNGRYLFGLPTGDMFDPAVGPAEGTALRLNLDIAMIDNALWKGDPAELHAEIRRLVKVARGETTQISKPEIAGTGKTPSGKPTERVRRQKAKPENRSKRPKPKSEVGKVFLANAATLALQAHLLIALIDEELRQLGDQRPNSQEEIDKKAASIAALEKVKANTIALRDSAVAFPNGEVSEEQVVKKVNAFFKPFRDMWSEKGKELAESSCRTGLFLGAMAIAPYCGVPITAGALILGAITAGKPLAEVLKASKGVFKIT